jgi:hypothetical protein
MTTDTTPVPLTGPSQRAKQIIENLSMVACSLDHLGAGELSDAEQLALDYIASLEAQVERGREDAARNVADAALSWLTSRDTIRDVQLRDGLNAALQVRFGSWDMQVYALTRALARASRVPDTPSPREDANA